MNIRVATNRDRNSITHIYHSAFPEAERDLVAQLAVNLLAEAATPPIISLVAEIESRVVGHVAYSPVFIENDQHWQGYILAPLAVGSEYQKRGIGSQLVNYVIQELLQIGVDILLVYGDPNYYSRFGFSADLAEGYIPPYELEYPFGWQAIKLGESQTVNVPVEITCVDALCNSRLW